MYSDTELLHCLHKKIHTLVQLTSDKLAIGLVKIIIRNVCISPAESVEAASIWCSNIPLAAFVFCLLAYVFGTIVENVSVI